MRISRGRRGWAGLPRGESLKISEFPKFHNLMEYQPTHTPRVMRFNRANIANYVDMEAELQDPEERRISVERHLNNLEAGTRDLSRDVWSYPDPHRLRIMAAGQRNRRRNRRRRAFTAVARTTRWIRGYVRELWNVLESGERLLTVQDAETLINIARAVDPNMTDRDEGALRYDLLDIVIGGHPDEAAP